MLWKFEHQAQRPNAISAVFDQLYHEFQGRVFQDLFQAAPTGQRHAAAKLPADKVVISLLKFDVQRFQFLNLGANMGVSIARVSFAVVLDAKALLRGLTRTQKDPADR